MSAADGTVSDLTLKDDGAAPDALADDGLYTAIMPYNQGGVYTVTTTLDNQAGTAVFTQIAARISVSIHTTQGTIIRFLATTGIGMIPIVGSALGVALGALDTFLLEKLLPQSGPASFINSLYPSIFEPTKQLGA